MTEQRPCPGFPNYVVGADGHVYRGERRLSPSRHHRTGHLRVRLYGENGAHTGSRGGRYSDVYVHRLICEAWWGACPDDYYLVRHLDGCSSNNVPENLVWGSARQNMLDYWAEDDALYSREERRGMRGEHPPYMPDLFLGF